MSDKVLDQLNVLLFFCVKFQLKGKGERGLGDALISTKLSTFTRYSKVAVNEDEYQKEYCLKIKFKALG